MRKMITTLCAVAMLAMAVNAMAQETIFLKGSGGSFKYDEFWDVIDLADGATEDVTYWHFVLGNKASFADVLWMELAFNDGDNTFVWGDEPFSSNNGGVHGWVVKTPIDWTIQTYGGNATEGDSFVITTAENCQFNLSGKVKVPAIGPKFGWLMANATIIQSHKKETHDPIYASVEPDTYVSWANAQGNNNPYNYGNGVTARVVDKNGFTALTIDKSKLPADGVDVQIALSNPANTPISALNGMGGVVGSYNVKIVGNEVVVTVINYKSGSWGFYVTNDNLNGNNPNGPLLKHKSEAVQKYPLPDTNKTTFDLFFHVGKEQGKLEFTNIIGCKNPQVVECNCSNQYSYVVSFDFLDCDKCCSDCIEVSCLVAKKFEYADKCVVDLYINDEFIVRSAEVNVIGSEIYPTECVFTNINYNHGCKHVECLFCNEHKAH